MSEMVSAIEDYTRLAIQRLRGELSIDDRPRLEALEGTLRDRIEGARPAPRKIENPSAVAAGRSSMNVKPAQVTVTRRGPGEVEALGASPSIGPAVTPARGVPQGQPPAPSAPPAHASAALQSSAPHSAASQLVPAASRPTPAAPRPAPAAEPPPDLSAVDRAKLNEISSRALPRTAYTPSVSPLYMDDYYESTLAPDHSISGNDKAQSVLSLGDDTMALPQDARVYLGLSDAVVVRAGSTSGVGSGSIARAIGDDDGELTELRGDGEETEAREPVFNTTPNARSPLRTEGPSASSAPPASRLGAAPRGTAPAPASVAPPPATSAPPRSAAPSHAAAPAPPRVTARPPAAAAPPPAQAPPPRSRAPEPAARPITPIIVQLLGGETKRGELVAFDPEGGVVSVRATPQAPDENLDINDVFAIFIGHARGVAPVAASGTRIAVRMTNDREVVGVSPDYAPGANAMTLVPDDRRTVDRIWIPAWSVTEIRFA